MRGQHKIAENGHFLDILRTITQEGSMETRQMAPFFSSAHELILVCRGVYIHYSPPPPMVAEKFHIYSIKITGKYICEPKNWICSFLLMFPKQNSPPGFYHYPPGKRKLSIPPELHFLKIFFLQQNRGERITKYWSQVLINSTIFATFFGYVLSCNDLASSMLKCEGSLT